MKELGYQGILVTRGRGFIGRPLIRAPADRGAQIFVLTRTLQSSSQQITYVMSLTEIGDVKIDIIVNLAGEPILQ